MTPAPASLLTLEPIGFVRSPFVELVEAPRQPAAARGVAGTVELASGRGFEHALEDLDSWSHLWLVFWFHAAGPSEARKVLPPRSTEKRGVFATRSPHRPNPIGLSLVRLVRVEGLTIHVEDLDLIDGTPVLDVKPYVPYADSAPDASSGWLEAPADPGSAWPVELSPPAEAQLAWLERHGEGQLRARLLAALALGPAPHPYRRIRELPGGERQLAVKAWRARFRVEEARIVVLELTSGHRPRDLAEGQGDELALHRAFLARSSP